MATLAAVVAANPPRIPSRLQLFCVALPSELLCSIFGHLSQFDCYECLLVCRLWNQLVPHYTIAAWRTIVLRSVTSRRRLTHFIGQHVREARLHSYHESKVLADLAWLQQHGAVRITTLSASYAVTGGSVPGGTVEEESHRQWIRALPADSLTCMTLRIGKPGIDLVRIVSACPRLVHLTYELADNGTGTLTAALQKDFERFCCQSLAPGTSLALRSLCFKSSLLGHYERRVLSTLARHSPHLQVMSLSGLWPLDTRAILDLIRPLTNLEYFACNVDRCAWLLDDTILKARRVSAGLRGLILQGSPDCSPEVLTFIRQHQHTLQHLDLTLGFHPRYDHDVRTLLARLRLAELESFHWSGCSSNRFGAALGAMLSQCGRLQTVLLPSLDGADRQWTQTLASLTHLSTLSLGIDDPWHDSASTGSPDARITAEDSDDSSADAVLSELFGAFAQQGDTCPLQNLTLKLRLGDGAVCLSHLSGIRTLKKLAIWGLALTDERAVSQVTNHISASKQMERLCLVSFRSLGRDALEHLSQMQHLRRLAIICCNQLSVVGLEHLVQTCPQLENVTVGQAHQVDGDAATWQSIKKRLGSDPRCHPLIPSVILS